MCQSQADGGKRCAGHTAHRTATALIPRRGSMGAYYAATDDKHFGDSGSAGSKFTDPTLTRLNDVVALAYRQRGHLDGDDRDQLAALGTPDAAFKPGIRYLLVRTPGTVGIRHSAGLPDDTPVHVTRMKPGAPCSLVLDVDTETTTDVGTIIIGRPEENGPEVVFTAHPGLPIPTDFEDRMSAHEGTTVALSVLRTAYGNDIWLNTRRR
jgi:hypothetical protein